MKTRKWLRRAIILVVILVLLYAGFWVAFFNPLEGSVDRLDALLPGNYDEQRGVTFYLHGPWGEIRESPLVKDVFLSGPIMDSMVETFDLERTLFGPVREVESQINDSVPGFLGKFSLLEDVVGREVVLAGYFSDVGEDLKSKIENTHFALLTRISFKARFMEVLKYESVQKQIPGLTGRKYYYEYDIGEENVVPGAPPEARYRFFTRIKDVLAVTNDEDLMRNIIHFASVGGESREILPQDFYYYYDTRSPGTSVPLTAWVRVCRADAELGHELEGREDTGTGSWADLLRAIFPIGYTRTVLLRAGLGEEDRIPLRGVIRFEKRIPDYLFGLHREEPEDLAEEVKRAAGEVPAAGAFAMLRLKMDVENFMLLLFETMGAENRALLFGGSSEPGNGATWPETRMASQLGSWFDGGVTITWSRLPEADEIDLDNWEGGVPKPLPATTFALDIKEQLDPEQVVEFFRRNRDQFGFDEPRELKAATGRLFLLKGVLGDQNLALQQFGFAIVGHRFLFSTNVGELGRMLETIAGQRESLADSPTLDTALGAGANRGNLLAYVDMERAMPYLRDQRYDYAFDASFFNQAEYRRQQIVDLTGQHGDWSMEQIQKEADELMKGRQYKMKKIDFPEAIEVYQEKLTRLEPFRWLGLTLTVAGDTAGPRLELKGAVGVERGKD